MLGHFVQESYGITTTAYQFGRKQGQPKYMVTEDYGTSTQGLVRMGGDVFPPMVAMERAIREAAALNGLVQSGDMDINMVDDLGYLRYVQALFGLKIKKRPDEEYLDYYYNKMLLDAIKTKTDDIGITTDGKVK